ncbi:ABC-three component system middle component 1 [Desulfosporosinus sp. OT]|uniref:ABC-three component system middle component 1 n=1 Tax=Desulfosporosinus sp. OT TaxID=913865 RepID=UPI000223AD08|nr:ABC-three component system middle component 1 [Desulfosporosinus sp. OT]EGW41746.1 hypothetical protein DOT_0271 [Desulfosporosinus sp. OT]
MKFEGIKDKIRGLITDRYEFDNDQVEFAEELLRFSTENLNHKEIFRIKRSNIEVDTWKTLVFIEIAADSESEIKAELKSALTWIASVKENLLGPESVDLYLFLAFNRDISAQECLRIESTEQFCRKYVLLPNEEISDFVNRTFLQRFISSEDTSESTDPLEKAFSKTLAQFSWLTPEVQKGWKKAFSELSGSELFDELLEGRN